MIKPEKLNVGDKVGIFVPSSPVKSSYRETGIKILKELGYLISKIRPTVQSRLLLVEGLIPIQSTCSSTYIAPSD